MRVCRRRDLKLVIMIGDNEGALELREGQEKRR